MRTWILFGGAVATCALSTMIACSSTESSSGPPSDPDGSDTILDDAGSDALPGDARADSSLDASTCSIAGWCSTPLPNSDLVVKDVWPLEGHAFAVAISPTVGVKVMEWADSASTWSYIDDGTQNEAGLGDYVGSLWAPNENELFYTVSPGYVYRGKRGSGTSWTWTRAKLPNNAPNLDPGNSYYDTGNPTYLALQLAVPGANGYPALGVSGTSADDTYAWFSNTVFHWKDGGSGSSSWVAEYSLDDTTDVGEHAFFLSAGTSATGEIWFSGARSFAFASCAIVVHKTAAGYARIVDGTIEAPFDSSGGSCAEKPGSLAMYGWLTDIQSSLSGRLFGLDLAQGLVELLPGVTDSDWSFRASKPDLTGVTYGYVSTWASPEAEFWLSGSGLVLRGAGVLEGTGTWEISSIGLNGAPIRKLLHRVRGTSTSNIWAVGEGYALHKIATP